MKRLLAIWMVLIMFLPILPVLGEGSEEESSAVITVLGEEQSLKYGDHGENVVEIQTLLSNLGYYNGKISGNYLEGTRAAIRKFQSEYGLEVTGICDSVTAENLRRAEYRVLDTNSDGEDVKRLQQKLIDLDYLNTNATGKFRSATKNAVKQFQEMNGLKATGEADLETQKLLFSDAALAKGVKPTATPLPEDDPGDTNDVVIAGDGESMDEPYEKKLTRGAKGEDVKKVQRCLTELGYFDGPISGNYMNQTVAAMKAFQKNNGVRTQNGVCDEETWNALFNSEDVVPPDATPRPTPVPTPIPYAITVDVRNQVTVVYGLDENEEHTVPVKYFICSTGMKATPSDVGDWVLTGRKARWCYFSKWGSHAQYWTQINPYIAFHSVIYNTVDLNNMSVKSYNKLGQRASHGCVRLLVNDAKWIYDNIGAGTVVTVTESLPDDEELRNAVKKPPLNSARNGPASTPVPTATPTYVSGAMPPLPLEKMKKGSEGENVYWLQCKLKELGFYKGVIATGRYLSGTVKAVKAFQKANGIYATGEADVKTLMAIFADVLATESPEQTETPAPSATPKP